MAHGSNDGYVVNGAAIVIIFYNLTRHKKKVNLPRIAAALGELIGDEDFDPGKEYGGPGSWIFELFIVGCRDPFELGRWAERVAALLRAHNAPRGDTVMVASLGLEWGVKVYPDAAP